MANRLENEINYFLRSTENVTIALEAFIVKGDLKFHKNKRILAVVIHQHESEGRYIHIITVRSIHILILCLAYSF